MVADFFVSIFYVYTDYIYIFLWKYSFFKVIIRVVFNLFYYMYTLINGNMATIQSKKSRGHKYWYIVESRRVNGKPRPVVLAYLGKAEDLLKRLQGKMGTIRLKSYSHGAVCALLKIAIELDVVPIINRHIQARRSYMPPKPLRHHLTAGITFLLGAIGRVCMPTSKRGWWNWAKNSSMEYLLRVSLSKINSQHFWDLMDCLPISKIATIECEILRNISKIVSLESHTLFFDTTNFYTYIHTTNARCTIAKRGKNKQKRYDLRQVGLAMVVTRKDYIPIFHLTYEGNMNDSKVFNQVIGQIKQRMVELKMDLQKHTIIFDRGNNSKKNLAYVKKLKLHYVGALTPYHHQQLIKDAQKDYQEVKVGTHVLNVFREKREIWGEERTVLVFVSHPLKDGQLRGIYQALTTREKKLSKLKDALANPKAKKRERNHLETTIETLLKGQYMEGLIRWSLDECGEGKFNLTYKINQTELNQLEDKLGFRILMTDRHDWKTPDIISCYYGQSEIERIKIFCQAKPRPKI